MGNGYYPLIPGGCYDGPEPDNYTGEDDGGNDPCGRDETQTWQTIDGRRIPYAQLEEKHLLNILRTCRAGVVKASDETKAALMAEVLRRRLEPLPDYESYEEGMTVSCVSALYLWWKRLPARRVPHATAVVDLYLKGGDVEQFTLDAASDERSTAEKHCLLALLAYDEWREKISPAAQMRCAEVFKRWAAAMGIAEELGL